MKKNLNVLLAIINAYEESDGFSNFSGTELNRTFGYATGYIEGNIVITTNRVNAAKNDMTTEEFKKLISDLYSNISNF